MISEVVLWGFAVNSHGDGWTHVVDSNEETVRFVWDGFRFHGRDVGPITKIVLALPQPEPPE